MRQTPVPSLVAASTLVAVLAVEHRAAERRAPDWPQFLGPERNGVYSGPPLAEPGRPSGPRKVWQKSGGRGLRRSGRRRRSGHPVSSAWATKRSWKRSTRAPARASGVSRTRPTYRDDFGFDEGPRAVPVVANGRIYTFGAEGQLHAIDAGDRQSHLERRYDAPVRRPQGIFRRRRARRWWKTAASSPTSAGPTATKGAGIVAFNADTGAVLWTATDHQASYSSPVGATFGGKRHAVFFTRGGLVGLDPATGAILFQRPWRSRSASSVNAATPLIIGD